MELDDMKAAWRELERRVEAVTAAQVATAAELTLERTRSELRRFARLPLLELVSGALLSLLLGSFLASHVGELRFAVPGAALLVGSIWTVAVSIRQLAALRHIDYAGPVVAIQRELAALRALRLRTSRWMLLLAPVVWTPLAIVAAEGLIGLDLYREPGPLWLASNLAFGVAASAMMVWISPRVARRWPDSPFLRSLADDLAGHSLVAAVRIVDRIDDFDRGTLDKG